MSDKDNDIGSPVWIFGQDGGNDGYDVDPDPEPIDNEEGGDLVAQGEEPSVTDDDPKPTKKPLINKKILIISSVCALATGGLVGYQHFKQETQGPEHISAAQQRAMMGETTTPPGQPNPMMHGGPGLTAPAGNPMAEGLSRQPALPGAQPGMTSPAMAFPNRAQPLMAPTVTGPSPAMPAQSLPSAPTNMPMHPTMAAPTVGTAPQDNAPSNNLPPGSLPASNLPATMTPVPSITTPAQPSPMAMAQTATSMSLPQQHQIATAPLPAPSMVPTEAGPGSRASLTPQISAADLASIQNQIKTLISQHAANQSKMSAQMGKLTSSLSSLSQTQTAEMSKIVKILANDQAVQDSMQKEIKSQSQEIAALTAAMKHGDAVDHAPKAKKPAVAAKKPVEKAKPQPKPVEHPTTPKTAKAAPKPAKPTYDQSAILPHWHLTGVSRTEDQIVSPNGTVFTVRPGEKFRGLGVIGATTAYRAPNGASSYELRTTHGIIIPKITR